MLAEVRDRCMLRKDSSHGIGYTVADVNGHRHVYASAVPTNGGDLREQAHDALQNIERLMHEKAPAADRAPGRLYEGRGAGRNVPADHARVLWRRTACHELRSPAALRRETGRGRGHGHRSRRLEPSGRRYSGADGGRPPRSDGVGALGERPASHCIATGVRPVGERVPAGQRRPCGARVPLRSRFAHWLYLGDIVGPEATRSATRS